MTGKRELPPLPHPDHLRKQAKTRLAAMRARLPTARLADAQLTLAKEYGFASWAALQAEVGKRVASPLGQRRHVRRSHVAPLYPERYRQDVLLEDEADVQTTQRFFLVGAAAQIGFLVAALTGMALLFVTPLQMQKAHELYRWLMP